MCCSLHLHRRSLENSTAHRHILSAYSNLVPSVLCRCWLGGKKGIRPVKNRVVGHWCGYLSGARCRLAYGPADVTGTHVSCFTKITWVVPDKGPLNGCVCSNLLFMSRLHVLHIILFLLCIHLQGQGRRYEY